MNRLGKALTAVLLLSLVSCGYALVGKGSSLPAHVKTVAILPVENLTPQAGLSERMTQALMREFVSRGKYKTVDTDTDADATLTSAIVEYNRTPVSVTEGRATFYQITLRARVVLKDNRASKVLFQNENYAFRDDYEVTQDAADFFDQEQESIDQIAKDFARSLVSTILEGF
jgi:outer membrane lipopolysaccharide assembly protein LptE/RlpB